MSTGTWALIIKMQALAILSLWIRTICHVAFCILSIPQKTLDSHFLTQKACQFVGFLLLDGFVVQRLKVDIQNQNVITANREREREKHDVLKSHIQMSLFIFSTLFFFIVFLRQRRWLVRLPLPADNRARVSSWANNLPSLSNFHGCGHWGKQGEVMTAVWFHTVLMS